MYIPSKRVLVVDDDPMVSEMIVQTLGRAGYEVHTLLNPLKAQEFLQKTACEVILLDQKMPELSGLELLQDLRTIGIDSEVIVCTNNPSYEIVSSFLELDIYELLAKPFKPNKLIHQVNKACEKFHLKKAQNTNQETFIQQQTELENALKQVNANLSFQDRLLKLIEIFQQLGRFSDLQELWKFIIASTTSLIQSDRSTLFLVDHETNELFSKVAEGMGTKEIRFPVGVGIAGAVAAEVETVLIPDAYADPRFNPAFDKSTGYRTRNILCMPMCNLESKVIGVIQVLNKLNGDFDEDDLTLLTAFNSLAAMSLESVMLFEETQKLTSNLQVALEANELLLENIQDGFCMINKEGNILQGYSKACEKLLNRTENALVGQPFVSIPFQPIDHKSDEFIREFDNWLDLGWNQPELEFWEDFSVDKVYHLGDKVLNMSFRRVREGHGVKSVLASIQDITERYELQQEVERKEEESKYLLAMAQSITKYGKFRIADGLKMAIKHIQDLAGAIHNRTMSKDQINAVFRYYHSLKGLFQSLSLDSLTKDVHEEEDEWMELRGFDEPRQIDVERHEFFGRLEKSIERMVHNFTLLYPDQRTHFPADGEEVSKISDRKYSWEFQYDSHSYTTISQVLKAEVMLHAEALQKKISWETFNRDIHVPDNIWKSMRSVLSHLLKNSIDHGLEDSETRLGEGKPPTGTIFFDYFQKAEEKRNVHIFITRDDGRGIHPERLEAKAIEAKIIASDHKLSKNEIIDLIFHPGFSTAEEVNYISGRGVGMDAVKHSVENELGGSIKILTQPGKGTEFQITIPHSEKDEMS